MNRNTTLEDITRESHERYIAMHTRDKYGNQPRRPLHNEHDWWQNVLIPPVAKALGELSEMHVTVRGPFGLGARVGITLSKDVDEKQVVGFVQLCPLDLGIGKLCWVNLDIYTGKYQRGTIGEYNGFNHPKVALPETIGELLDIAMSPYKKKANNE